MKRTTPDNIRGPWGPPPLMEPLVRELAERLLADPGLTESFGYFLATAPGGPPELRLLGSRLSHAATVEPLRRLAPKAGRGRPARWGSERNKVAEGLARDRARLDALHRWIAGRDDGTVARLFEGDLLEAVRASIAKALRSRHAEKTARRERGPAQPLHAPRLWAARVLLKVTGRDSSFPDAERLVKRLKTAPPESVRVIRTEG